MAAMQVPCGCQYIGLSVLSATVMLPRENAIGDMRQESESCSSEATVAASCCGPAWGWTSSGSSVVGDYHDTVRMHALICASHKLR